MKIDPYISLVAEVLALGDKVPDRTGTGTVELFGRSICYDLNDGFPLCVWKKTNFKNILVETLWLLRGEPKLDFMHEHGCHHWDPWLPKDQRFGVNSLGRVYGVQWRDWRPSHFQLSEQVDQIVDLMKGLKENPHGRRHVVTCWNPSELRAMALPPCHMLFQMHVSSRGRLSCQVYQRSADLFIGVPYDIGMYAILTHMMARVLGLYPGELIFNFGSAHVYLNHVDQATDMLARAGAHHQPPWPYLLLRPDKQFQSLDQFEVSDFELDGYNPFPAIKAPVSV